MVLATPYQDGKVFNYANSSGQTIPYKTILVINDFIAIVLADILDGESGSVTNEGSWLLPASAGVEYAQGDAVHWNASGGVVTATKGANAYAGTVLAAKASAATEVLVKLGRHVVDADTLALADIGDIDDSNVVGETIVDMINTLNEHTDTANAAKIAELEKQPSQNSTLTLSAPGVTQTISGQLKDINGDNIVGVTKVRAYMCTDSAGATPSSSGTAGDVTATTGAILKAHTAKLDFDIVTNATGAFVLSFPNTGGGDTYTDKLALVLPTGDLKISDALAVATA